MRLSTAMMLGASTCKMIPGDINSCALGAALNAVGAARVDGIFDMSRVVESKRLWPWLTEICPCCSFAYGSHIAITFNTKVCKGEMTFEQLVDWVRSVEPDEPIETTEPIEQSTYAGNLLVNS